MPTYQKDKPYEPTPKLIEKYFIGFGEDLPIPEACAACNFCNCTACRLDGLGKDEADALAIALTAQAIDGNAPYDRRFLKEA